VSLLLNSESNSLQMTGLNHFCVTLVRNTKRNQNQTWKRTVVISKITKEERLKTARALRYSGDDLSIKL
jgi:hypothetical protein